MLDHSDPSREPPREGAADSLSRRVSACDMLSSTESLTDDSESLTDSVPLSDS